MMATTFSGPDPWDKISKAARTKGPRLAAIAYIGVDAPKLLPLRRGDVLVVNAGKAALRARATSPTALKTFIDRGVEVYSLHTLHAKVIATSTTAVIGSANASRNSTQITEAVIISETKTLVKSVTAFVNGLENTIVVDDAFVDDAQKQWDLGKATHIPGVGRVGPESEEIDSANSRLFLMGVDAIELTAPQQKFKETATRPLARKFGPKARFGLQLLLMSPGRGFRVGDRLIYWTKNEEGETVLEPPVVVFSEGKPIPWGRGNLGYVVRYDLTLGDVSVDEASISLKKSGVPRPLLTTDRQISKKHQKAFLDLWQFT